MRCPQCNSQKIVKDGLRYTLQAPIQRYLCLTCGYRFSQPNVKLNIRSQNLKTSDPSNNHTQTPIFQTDFAIKEIFDNAPFTAGKDVGSHNVSTLEKGLNNLCFYNRNAEVCASDKKAKNSAAKKVVNLAKTINQNQHEAAGATKQQDVKAKLIEFAWHMKKEGMTENTIATFTCLLKRLQDYGADLFNPESVKEALTKIPMSQNSKATMKGAYSCFLNFIGKTWNPPKLQYQNKIPFIPLESEIDQLIAGCSKTISAILQLIKETGMRIGEALRLKWTDFNPANNTIILNEPEKNSNPGIYKISNKLANMLQSLPKKTERIFGNGKVRDKQWIFTLQRRKLAVKLGNPRLTQITFHTIRHWKGTMEYHKTKDPYHVKQILRHKSLKSTEIYINIEQAIFNEDNSEFHVKVADTLEEACKLLEVGFEYVTDMDGKKIFRKRK